MLLADLDLPVLDVDDTALRGERFHEVLGDLASRAWLARTSLGIAVFDREVGLEMLRDRRMSFPSLELLQLQGITEGPIYERVAEGLLAKDGDEHGRLRRLLTPAFTPAATERLRPSMREHLREMWRAAASAGECEFVGAFAKRLPSMVIADLLGVPDDHERMALYSEQLQAPFSMDVGPSRADLEQAYVDAYDWIAALVEERRRHRGNDLVSTLVSVEQQGDRLTTSECVSLISSVISGGTDTTQAQLAQGMRLFAEHPEHWDRLARQPELAAAAANEVVRYEPITPFTARLTRDTTAYRSVEFPPDTVLFICAATANRDPSVFHAPDRFDITRAHPNGAVLTFGSGPHICIGATLARVELAETYGFLAPRLQQLELAAPPVYGSPAGIYPLEELRLRFAAVERGRGA